MIVIIDYGMGNLASVYNALQYVKGNNECKIEVTSDFEIVKDAEKIVLPGVGAFGDAIKNLEKFKLINVIIDSINSGKFFLGICLGYQLLFEKSYENGIFNGLGILKGEVVRFQTNLPVPHMGWNIVKVLHDNGIYKGIKDNSFFYFDHSYYPLVEDINIIAMKTIYDYEFASAINYKNVYGVQFHPEKSHNNGLKIIKNFVDLK